MKILLRLQYLGTDFCGWQFQPGVRTVQNTLTEAAEALFGKKCLVVAALYYALLTDNDDLIRIFNGGEAVGNDDNRSAVRELLESRLDLHFGGVVKRTRCLVKDKKLGIL